MSKSKGQKRAERLQVMLTQDEVRAVEDWRFDNRMPSRSAAVRALMNRGLKAHAAAAKQNEAETTVGEYADAGVGPPVLYPRACGPRLLVYADDFLTGEGLTAVLRNSGYDAPHPALSRIVAERFVAREAPAAAILALRFDDHGRTREAVEFAGSLAPSTIILSLAPDHLRRSDLPEPLASGPLLAGDEVQERLVPMLGSLLCWSGSAVPEPG